MYRRETAATLFEGDELTRAMVGIGMLFADHADAFRIRRPDREQDTAYCVDFMHMGAEEAIGMAVFTLTKQMQVKVL